MVIEGVLCQFFFFKTAFGPVTAKPSPPNPKNSEPNLVQLRPQRMKIFQLEPKPLTQIRFLNAGRRKNDFFVDQLPVLHGQVDELPDGLDALVVTADLQGREPLPEHPDQPLRLIGEVLPSLLAPTLYQLGIGGTQDCGIILAGDFYTYPDLRGRGGTGDVTSVWQVFAESFKLVVGVAGNHDVFGDGGAASPHLKPPPMGDHVHFLNGTRVNAGGKSIAGVSGVIGNPRKNFRRTHEEFLEIIQYLLLQPTDVLVLHDGPDAPMPECKGITEVREILERSQPKNLCQLVIRGHKHWPTPLVELTNGVQILNVEATVVILTAE